MTWIFDEITAFAQVRLNNLFEWEAQAMPAINPLRLREEKDQALVVMLLLILAQVLTQDRHLDQNHQLPSLRSSASLIFFECEKLKKLSYPKKKFMVDIVAMI